MTPAEEGVIRKYLGQYTKDPWFAIGYLETVVEALDACRATNTRLNRRATQAEAACAVTIAEMQRQGVSIGRDLARIAWRLEKDKREKAEAANAELSAALTAVCEERDEAQDEAGRLREALIWCSGSNDFQVGGIARVGWEKLCVPLLNREAT